MIGPEARGAWHELEKQLRPYVARRVASPDEIDDVVQDIFLKLHQGLGTIQDDESFGGWVYRVARNTLADRGRAKARGRAFTAGGTAIEEVVPATSEELDDLQANLGECVALFVSRLPSPYREAITLTELQGLAQKDAAQVLGVSLSALKSQVLRGRAKIRDMFEACCEISVDARGRVLACEARELSEVPPACRDTAAAWAKRNC
jgi:RNA polymerase sigma-70 factor (ECF subfamily)